MVGKIKLKTEGGGTLDLEKFIDGLHEYLAREIKPLVDRIKALEAELIEARNLKYCGTWRKAVYLKNNLVTDHGALWICERSTDRRPGDGDSGWKLVAKGL